MQVTPLARPVNRGVFGARSVPSAVPISMPASGAPDADRWAAVMYATAIRKAEFPDRKLTAINRAIIHQRRGVSSG